MADVPADLVAARRFAEFFRVDGGQIQSLKLLYDLAQNMTTSQPGRAGAGGERLGWMATYSRRCDRNRRRPG